MLEMQRSLLTKDVSSLLYVGGYVITVMVSLVLYYVTSLMDPGFVPIVNMVLPLCVCWQLWSVICTISHKSLMSQLYTIDAWQCGPGKFTTRSKSWLPKRHTDHQLTVCEVVHLITIYTLGRTVLDKLFPESQGSPYMGSTKFLLVDELWTL